MRTPDPVAPDVDDLSALFVLFSALCVGGAPSGETTADQAILLLEEIEKKVSASDVGPWDEASDAEVATLVELTAQLVRAGANVTTVVEQAATIVRSFQDMFLDDDDDDSLDDDDDDDDSDDDDDPDEAG
jgi:hypothetical protein